MIVNQAEYGRNRGPEERLGSLEQAGEVRGRRILIIEDNTDAADTLGEILEMEGHTLAVAYSGADGIEKARDFRPEVVLCDIGLPDMDGHGVARALRAGGCEAAILVALSGFTRRKDIESAIAAGFDTHLAKPPDLDAIDRLLATLGDETGT